MTSMNDFELKILRSIERKGCVNCVIYFRSPIKLTSSASFKENPESLRVERLEVIASRNLDQPKLVSSSPLVVSIVY